MLLLILIGIELMLANQSIFSLLSLLSLKANIKISLEICVNAELTPLEYSTVKIPQIIIKVSFDQQ